MEQLLHATLHIECRSPSGPRRGTGLIFAFLANAPCLVTTKTLMADAASCRLTFAATAPDGGPDPQSPLGIEVQDLKDGVLNHPDADVDLAILPLAPLLRTVQDAGKSPFFRAAPPALIPTSRQLQSLPPRQDVFLLAYPDRPRDDANTLPVMLPGVTASPASVNVADRQDFFINARPCPGAAGSPVFAYHRSTPSDSFDADWIFLIGLLSAAPAQGAVAVPDRRGDGAASGQPMSRSSGAPPPPDRALCLRANRILDFEPMLLKRGVAAPPNYIIRAAIPDAPSP